MSSKEKEKKGISRRDFIKASVAATAAASAGGMVDFISPRPSYAQTPSGTINVVTSADDVSAVRFRKNNPKVPRFSQE